MNPSLFTFGFSLFLLLPIIGIFVILKPIFQVWRVGRFDGFSRRLRVGYVGLSLALVLVSLFGLSVGQALLGIVNFIPFFFFYLAASSLLNSPERLKQWAWAVVAPASLFSLIGLGQLFWGWGGLLKISHLTLWGFIADGNPPGRMSSAFMHANSYGSYLVVVLTLGLALLINLFELQKRRDRRWAMQVGFLLVTLGLCVLCILLTSSRAAWGVAVLVIFALGLYKAWYWLVFFMSGGFLAVLVSAFDNGPLGLALRRLFPYYIWGRLNDAMYAGRPEGITRLSQFNYAWQLTLERPLTGWGMMSFGPLYEAHSGVWVADPHNLLLLMTSSVGLPVTVALVCLVGWPLVKGVQLLMDFPKDWRQGKILYFAYIVGFFSLLALNMSSPEFLDLRINTLGWTLLAGITGLVRVGQTQPHGRDALQ